MFRSCTFEYVIIALSQGPESDSSVENIRISRQL